MDGRQAGRPQSRCLRNFQGAVTRLLTRILRFKNIFRIGSAVPICVGVDFWANIITRLLTRTRFFQALKISLSIPTIKYYRT